jgi:[acyl-carrier-protein] S-malonyltransferase
MDKVAFLFPGQGSQMPGMGISLSAVHAEARMVLEEADEVLGFGLSILCFEGPKEALMLTENAQPALLAVSVAAHRALVAQGIEPDYVAGHSLGEYSALVAAGAIEFRDALKLVRKRGRFMQSAVPVGVGSMAALLKLPSGALDGILREAAQGESVSAANYNSPDQIVIAGHTGAVQRAMELAKKAGARKTVLLGVSAPFHSPLMVPAQLQMQKELEAVHFNDLRYPLINNWQAAEVRTGRDAREGLFHQIPNPVRWSDSIELLARKGVKDFIEVGTGGVLTGLLKNIDPELRGTRFGEAADLENVVSVAR